MAKRIDCFWGQSGTGKSEGIAKIVEHIFEQSGLKARAIIGDGSRSTYDEHGLIDAGVMDTLDFTLWEWPSTTLTKLCEGWWPKDSSVPNSPLLPPTPETMSKLGVFVVEGLSVGSQYLLGDQKGGLSEQASRGIKIGQDSPIRYADILYDKDGNPVKGSGPGTSFGGNPIAHFGVAQRRILGCVERTKAFPNWVIWSAHERSTQDRISGEKLVGPEAAGEALTANIGRIFGNTLHFVSASRKKAKVKDEHTEQMITDLDVEFRVYTRDHFHPDGTTFVKYKAVTRGVSEADGLKLYYTSDIPGMAVMEYYQFLADIRNARLSKLKEVKAS